MSTLLEQILAQRADPRRSAEARAVYADELQARGDPRGELIALDLALATEWRRELVERKAQLVAEHGETWWPGISVERLGIRRGFVDRVAAAPEELVRPEVASWFAREPVRGVQLFNASGRFEEAPWQAHLTELAVRGGFDPASVLSLGTTPLAMRLETLDLGWAAVADVPALASTFPGVRALSLADIPLAGARIVGALGGWARRDRIERLDLRRCAIGALEIANIVVGMRSLRELYVSGNPIGPDGAIYLASKLPALERLEIVGAGVGGEEARALRAAMPRATIVVDPPDAIELDIVGHALRFQAVAGVAAQRWRVLVDGIPRRVEITHSVQWESDSWANVTHGDSGMEVELGALPRAIAEGAVAVVGPGDTRLHVVSEHTVVDGTEQFTTRMAVIVVTPRAVEIRLEEWIDMTS